MLLSALLTSLAFWEPDAVGWVIIPGIYCLVVVGTYQRVTFSYGFIWGLMVFSLHFNWLLWLFLNKLVHSPWWFTCAAYSLFVGYSALLSGACLALCGILNRCTRNKNFLKYFYVPVVISCFFIFFQRYAFSVLFGADALYPLFNPLLLLINKNRLHDQPSCVPLYNLAYSSAWYQDMSLYHRLKSHEDARLHYAQHTLYNLIERCNMKSQNEEIIYGITPESMLTGNKQRCLEVLKMLSHYCISRKSIIFVPMSTDEGQQLYCLSSKMVIKMCTKEHHVLFIEKLPWFLRSCMVLQKIFGVQGGNNNENEENDVYLTLDNNISIIPALCSEFFCAPSIVQKRLNAQSKNDQCTCIFLFVNDSWFNSYAQNLLKRIAKLNTIIYFKVPTLYIGSRGFTWISP